MKRRGRCRGYRRTCKWQGFVHANRKPYISWHLGRSYLGRAEGALVQPQRTARTPVWNRMFGFIPSAVSYRIQIALLTRDDWRSWS